LAVDALEIVELKVHTVYCSDLDVGIRQELEVMFRGILQPWSARGILVTVGRF